MLAPPYMSAVACTGTLPKLGKGMEKLMVLLTRVRILSGGMKRGVPESSVVIV